MHSSNVARTIEEPCQTLRKKYSKAGAHDYLSWGGWCQALAYLLNFIKHLSNLNIICAILETPQSFFSRSSCRVYFGALVGANC